ncbi:MAG: hypothetical protein HY726_00155 [Candidatus Rokubacteria bacterium]|nr:hypothetical protein [Candidatus Rokubacteria bacterium]
MKWWGSVGIAFLVVGMAGSGAGQTSDTPDARQQAEKRLESLYLVQLADALRLSDEQVARVAARVRRADDQRRMWLQERRRVVQDLEELLKRGQSDPKAYEEKIARWEQVEVQLALWRKNLLNELRSVLTAEQQAKFVMFDESFAASVRELLRSLRLTKP